MKDIINLQYPHQLSILEHVSSPTWTEVLQQL